MVFQYDAHVVAGNYRTVDKNGKVENHKKYSKQCIKAEGNLYGYPLGKVYKSELFEHLHFPDGYWYEDSNFA